MHTFVIHRGASIVGITMLAASMVAGAPKASANAQSPTLSASSAAPAGTQAFSQQELDAIVAPIALYPDSVLSQVFMASTYPLQVVEADRWVQANKNLTGDALTKALEGQKWDPSVKSLVNFPQVLDMMSTQLDWTQKLGDAFIEQQKQLMDTVQSLRAKAKAQGQLESNAQQTVSVQPGPTQTIVIQPTNPQVIYVPAYNPTVVYGAWPYPAYPPYPVYPAGYVAASSAFSFGVGVAVGAAWGYAWGSCKWNHGDVNVNVNQNTNINNNINRSNYQNYQNNLNNGQGQWQHNANARGNTPYRSDGTAQKFGTPTAAQTQQARDAYRGRADQGRSDIARGDAAGFTGGNFSGGAGAGGANRTGAGGSNWTGDRGQGAGGAMRQQGSAADRSSAFDGVDRGGGYQRSASDRGAQSRGYSGYSGGNRGGGGGGGAFSRGGGGGGRR